MQGMTKILGENFFIESNDALAHVVLPALRQVNILTITDNPRLPACEVEALFGGIAGTRTQERNDTTATCTP